MADSEPEGSHTTAELAGEDGTPPPPSFPPYPPYEVVPAPPSVVDAIMAGRDIRRLQKSVPPKSVRPVPRPAKPRGPKATDVKMSRKALRAHARCLRRHGAVLTDRLELISKPRRRTIISLWRENAHLLAPETISRLRSMLDADEPFKPDQAYQYFINLRKTKKRNAALKVNQIKKEVLAICGDKRFVWARNATVAFARGIQQRLTKPGTYALADGMLRLSDIILDEICGLMHMRAPSRKCRHPKAKFMMEMADKVAVWIDEILTESEDRMLMMDFDEDEDVLKMDGTGDARFADDFLNMMGDGGGKGGGGGLLKGPRPAYLKFTGDMLEAFIVLTDSMAKKGDTELLTNGKFKQTYSEAADELKRTPNFDATDFNVSLAEKVSKDLADTAKPHTPSKLAPAMKDMVNICSNFLAQNAENNKNKGPAFKLLVKTMKGKPGEMLYQKDKAKRNNGQAATELEQSKGLETDHDDPNLSQEIHSKLTKLTDGVTTPELKSDMDETLDICSKYLSQRAIDEIERGPAFDLLIQELEKDGSEKFSPEHAEVSTKFAAAYVLKTAPGFTSIAPDPPQVPKLEKLLHQAVDAATPKSMKKDMDEVIPRCAKYLSGFIRDRGRALKLLVDTMKKTPGKEYVKRNSYTMTYGDGIKDIEAAPMLVPFLPVKDIADEGKAKLTADMEKLTPQDLQIPMKTVINDVAKHVSQAVAVRGNAGGARYELNLVSAIMKALGSRPLFKYLSFGQTYSDGADVLKFAGPLESDTKHADLKHRISSEMKVGMPKQMAHTIVDELKPTMDSAAQHLAKVGGEKGDTLEHLVNLMKKKGDAPLGQLQGYQQTYNDGARRIEIAPSLTNDKVDKGAYESVRGKLTQLVGQPPAEHEKYMPTIIDESAKFLAAPMPETGMEKRRMLADLMARKGDEIVGEEGPYKLTYTEGGQEIMKAPVGVTTAHDEKKKNEMVSKVTAVIPDKKLQEILKDSTDEGSAHLVDVIKGRGEAMEAIQAGLNKEKDRDFLTLEKFGMTHGETSDMLSSATHFGGQQSAPVLQDMVLGKLDTLPKDNLSSRAKEYMDDAKDITSQYVAAVAARQSGLDMAALATLDVNTLGKGAGKTSRVSVAGIKALMSGHGLGAGAEPRPSTAGTKVGLAKGLTADGSDSQARARARGSASAFGLDADEENRRKRLSDEERRRKEQEEEERRRREKEDEEKRRGGRQTSGPREDYDPEKEAALKILHKQLKSHGNEIFYSQPHTELSHLEASKWLAMKPPMKVDKSVKESGDTARLHKKFERKLSNLVSNVTPSAISDVMQDVVVESGRILSECFVSNNYKALVREALISGMQKRGNEILVESNNASETFFFAAQRLKKAKSLEVEEPCPEMAYYLSKKIDECLRCRSMVRKITGTMKEHVQDAANYLSACVTKPDAEIEAYVALLAEMEAAGDSLLIEGDIPKSFKDAATYLRDLTTFEDQIRRSNILLHTSTTSKLKSLMYNVTPRGYSSSTLNGVISDCAKLLVSYIMLQAEMTKALNQLICHMDLYDKDVLLRHGNIRKSYSDGAKLLRGKNTDQLNVTNPDPVAVRKIEIKLKNLAEGCIYNNFSETIVDDVVAIATKYLAVHLLQAQVVQVCKCMKNVFVQCELWCEEILRRVARPCCTCSRHVSAQALQDLAPLHHLHRSPNNSHLFAPGVEITLETCPSSRDPQSPCPNAPNTTPGCAHNPAYFTYSTTCDLRFKDPFRLTPETSHSPVLKTSTLRSASIESLINDIYPENPQLPDSDRHESSNSSTYLTPLSSTPNEAPEKLHDVSSPSTWRIQPFRRSRSPIKHDDIPHVSRYRSVYNTRTPIVSTDQMSDWHAMVISLMWNTQAWRGWIQDNIDRALSQGSDDAEENWEVFYKRFTMEAVQWRQYNNFSRLLSTRLLLRYKDKKIVSPTRATVKTQDYIKYQIEMLNIIEMFNKWTRWLFNLISETASLQQCESGMNIHESRWNHLKKNVCEYAQDWAKYNSYLKMCWEQRHKTIIANWLPAWTQSGPVWVVSACGAVPSGAVAAGVYDGEVIWVARSTHKCNVLPAALHPSKHCCLMYADGAVHRCTKYQVLCNAEAKWVAWRAGTPSARAVRVARGVDVGRVLYRGHHLVGAVRAPHGRCHVVIYGRPFAFNCYELLVLANE